MSVSVTTAAGNTVSVSVNGGSTVTLTTTTSSVSVSNSSPNSIAVTEKGPKGDTGATGPQGPQGPAGADGQGVPTGGLEGQALFKSSATDYDTAWDYVESTYLQVENAETTAIAAGTVVYAFGVSGANITVKKADASASSTMPAIGVVLEDIASGSSGEIITSGLFNKTISGLSGVNVGDTVYVSETAGSVTTTKPIGTALIQNIGVVLKTNGSNIQKMKVSAIDRVNDVPNIPNGQIWIGNASGVATPTAFGVDLDSTPQLGGDLDVNGNKITSASNGDITIDPDGTGAIILKSDDIQFDGDGGFGTGKIKLYESDVVGSNFIAISAPLSVTSDTTFILPDGPPSVSDYALVSSAAGALSWKSLLDGNTETLLGTTSLKPVGALDAMLAFYDDAGDNYIILRAPDVLTGNTTFVLPAADGSANQVIKTDGSGNLSFVDQPSGTVDTFGTPANTQLAIFTDSDTIKGVSNLEWNGSALELDGALEANSIRIDPSVSLSSAGDYSMGSRVLKGFGTNTTGLTVGDVYQYDGGWDAARATTTDGTKMLCVASDTQSRTGMVKEGIVKMADSTGFSSATDGDVLYLDSAAGHVTTTAPTGSSAVVRVVGYVYDASAGTIYFDPSKDWIELTA